MKIFAVEGVKGNFGDELNGWMWQRLAPELFASSDGPLFVGIGTLLDNKLPPTRMRVVFGSGAGYGRLPDAVTRGAGWMIYGVRGKLTAQVLNLADDLAATDPAILLATFADLRAPRSGATIFIPHWKTMRFGRWAEVCAACNVRLVDPCQDSQTVIREISAASKVIAESMHAAIIADCFRVPWVPVVLSREVSAFKWRDWGSSLGVPYAPQCIPPSSPVERLRDKLLASISAASIKNYPTLDEQRSGVALDFSDDAAVVADFLSNVGKAPKRHAGHAGKLAEIVLKRISLLEQRALPAMVQSHARYFHDACRAMERAKSSAGFLSDERAHAAALEDTLLRLERVRSDYHDAQ